MKEISLLADIHGSVLWQRKSSVVLWTSETPLCTICSHQRKNGVVLWISESPLRTICSHRWPPTFNGYSNSWLQVSRSLMQVYDCIGVSNVNDVTFCCVRWSPVSLYNTIHFGATDALWLHLISLVINQHWIGYVTEKLITERLRAHTNQILVYCLLVQTTTLILCLVLYRISISGCVMNNDMLVKIACYCNKLLAFKAFKTTVYKIWK